MSKTTKKVQEIVEESETTENEFSEAEEVKFRGKSQNILDKVKKEVNEKVEDSKEGKPQMARNVPVDLKYKNLKVRTFWTIVMLVLFIGIIAAGHIYCALLIFAINSSMVKEILSLKRNRERENEILFSVKLNWYFFAVAVFYFYGKLFSSVLARVTLTSKVASFLLVDFHDIISFALWIIGFLMFTLSLKKGFLRYQFRQFGWTHICVFLIVAQGTAMVKNVYEGIIWFLLPALLVISNDTFAYLFGIAFGKTPLIKLSPKKTWEGFIGGSFSTLVFAFIFSRIFSQIGYLVCPQHDLVFKPFQFPSCQVPDAFVLQEYNVSWIPILNFFTDSMTISEFQFHSLFLALFTTLVSPFGGFFASGFKRAIKVKDFADVIPGHGGITDRMDCQVLTGTFVYLYVHQIVKGRINYVNGVTRFIINELNGADQLSLFNALQSTLIEKGILNATLAVNA